MQRSPNNAAKISRVPAAPLTIPSGSNPYRIVRSNLPAQGSFQTLIARAVSHSNLPLSILRAEENERKRIGRDLHDEMGQRLMALRFYLGTVVKHAGDGPLKLKAEESLALLDDTIDGLRRIIGSLSPSSLENLGLVGAIRKEAKALSRQTGMKSHLAFPKHLGPLSSEIQLAVYRTVQEALTNISKHSGAQNFGVAIEQQGGWLALRIDDDGGGFSRKTATAGFGITGMNGRIKELGGTMQIRSRKGGGTIIHIEIPFAGSVDHNTDKDLRTPRAS